MCCRHSIPLRHSGHASGGSSGLPSCPSPLPGRPPHAPAVTWQAHPQLGCKAAKQSVSGRNKTIKVLFASITQQHCCDRPAMLSGQGSRSVAASCNQVEQKPELPRNPHGLLRPRRRRNPPRHTMALPAQPSFDTSKDDCDLSIKQNSGLFNHLIACGRCARETCCSPAPGGRAPQKLIGLPCLAMTASCAPRPGLTCTQARYFRAATACASFVLLTSSRRMYTPSTTAGHSGCKAVEQCHLGLVHRSDFALKRTQLTC